DASRTVGADWPMVLAAAEPVEVIGDATRLRQVFDNLLGNVRAHTPAGTEATVTVAANGDQAVVTVADNGPGLDPIQATRVFERFYRADSSRWREHGGAGLGPPIVPSVVSAH